MLAWLRSPLGGEKTGRGAQLFSSTRPPTPQQAAELAAVMPELAGRPLEPPRFHPVNWRVGDVFTAQDDPDRVFQPWSAPQFVTSADPREQAQRTTVEELTVPRAEPGRRFARVVRGTMDPDQCASLISHVNARGFTPALLNIGRGRQELEPVVRDGHRVIVESEELASWLLEVIRPYLPEQLADGARLVGLNERCRFLCYTPGQMFEEHHDACYQRPTGHPRAGDTSEITVQVYLHDVPETHGGATTFFPSNKQCSVKHQPEMGSVLLFTQDLPHEGSLVSKGLKYTLRTEAMYTRRK